MSSQLNFIRQQGFKDAAPETCDYRYPALMWQPRLITVLVLIGLLLETGWYFLGLSAILWWSALLPRMNPFDAMYNGLVARRRKGPPLHPAPAPRRFAQGVAGTFMLAIGLAVIFQRPSLAWTLQGILLAFLAALVFGRFCVGSYLFLLLSGRGAFANRTLPWARSD